MQTHKKIFFGIVTCLIAIVLLGLVSDWKYYGFTNLLWGSDGKAATANRPKIKAAKKPNFLVENVFISPKSPKVGDTISLIAKIKNTGQESIEELKVKFSDAKGWGDSKKTNIKEDLYRYVKVELQPQETHLGEHVFQVFLDSNDKYDESNEKDNSYEFKLNIGPK